MTSTGHPIDELAHVAFKVDDVRGVVGRVREAGVETVGEIVEFENTFLLCYVRGPEGLIFEAHRTAAYVGAQSVHFSVG